MKDETKNHADLVTEIFRQYHSAILGFIRFKINDECDAEDLAQDVFVRLLECKEMLRSDTAKSLVYTIARNLVIDYLRRLYKKQEITSYIYDMRQEASSDTMDGIVARDLAAHERMKLVSLPRQRRIIYSMSRFQDKSADEISDTLRLSKRTVENHLRIGRHEMRTYMSECI